MTIKGSLLMSLPIKKCFWLKIVPPKRGLKIHVWGFRKGKFLILNLRPPRNQSPPGSRRLTQKRWRCSQTCVLQSCARNHTKLKKYLNMIFHPFADCCFSMFFRRNHAYRILSRSRYGATGVQNRGFPIHFQTALTTTVLRYALPCYTVICPLLLYCAIIAIFAQFIRI